MFRRSILSIILSITLCFSLFAQNIEQTGGYARILGMGNNPYLIDPYFITVNPAWGSQYPNFLFGDLGSSNGNFTNGSGQFVAANFHLGGGLTLGALLSRNDFSGFSIARLDPGVFTAAGQNPVPLTSLVPGVLALNNNLEFMGAYKTGNLALGFGIAYASTNNESNPPTGSGTVGSASQIGINAGLLAKLTGSIKLDLGASLIMPSATFEPATGSNTEFSQTIILVNGRLFLEFSPKVSFVPLVIFTTASGTADLGGTTTTSRDLSSYSIFIVGLGVSYSVGDFLLVGGPSLASASITFPAVEGVSPELSNSDFIFPSWNLGVEWKLTDWFIGRIGYVASTHSVTTETPATSTTVSELIQTQFLGQQGATVGIGFRFGNFSLDATVNEDALRHGLNNIANGNIPTFGYLSGSFAIP